VDKSDDSVQDIRDPKACFLRARVVEIGDQIPSRGIHAMLRSGVIRWLEKPVDLVKLAAVLADLDFER
jgi:hypothetical protein